MKNIQTLTQRKVGDFYQYNKTFILNPNETKEDSIRIDKGGDFVCVKLLGLAQILGANDVITGLTDDYTLSIKDTGSARDWSNEPMWALCVVSNYSKQQVAKIHKLIRANDQVFITVRNYTASKLRIQIVLEGYRKFGK